MGGGVCITPPEPRQKGQREGMHRVGASRHLTWPYTFGMAGSPGLRRLRPGGGPPELDPPSEAARAAGAPPSPPARSTLAPTVKKPLSCGSVRRGPGGRCRVEDRSPETQRSSRQSASAGHGTAMFVYVRRSGSDRRAPSTGDPAAFTLHGKVGLPRRSAETVSNRQRRWWRSLF